MQAVDPRPLTETSQMHLNSLRASQEHVTQQIDAITGEQAGLPQTRWAAVALAAAPVQHPPGRRPLPRSCLGAAEGLEFLGRLRQGFLQRMDKVKQELGQLVVQASTGWAGGCDGALPPTR